MPQNAVAAPISPMKDPREGLPIPGPPPPLDLPVAPLLPSLAFGGPSNPDPPVPDEALGRDWPALMTPPAARPYFTHEGLDSRGYHPQLGGSTGIRADSAPLRRWCEERKELVTQETCASCPVEECGYESEQEDEKREPEESEREE